MTWPNGQQAICARDGQVASTECQVAKFSWFYLVGQHDMAKVASLALLVFLFFCNLLSTLDQVTSYVHELNLLLASQLQEAITPLPFTYVYIRKALLQDDERDDHNKKIELPCMRQLMYAYCSYIHKRLNQDGIITWLAGSSREMENLELGMDLGFG